MSEMKVVWSPHVGPQTVFLGLSHFEVLYGGARGGGKTDCLLYGALRQVEVPGYRALVLRRTFPELREVMDRAQGVFRSLGGNWVASEKRWRFPVGSTVEFGYCGNWAEVQQYQGQQYQYIGFDEMGMLAEERVWVFLFTSCRSSDPGIVRMMRASANPGGAGHGWIKRRFIQRCLPDGTAVVDEVSGLTRAFVQARVRDNPSLMDNDPDYVRRLMALPEMLRRQHLDGDWDAGEGLAFPAFRASLPWVVDRYDRAPQNPFGGFDWGFGHRWAFQLWDALPGGRVCLVDSTSGRRQIPREIAERVGALLEGYGMSFGSLRYTVAGSDVKIQDGARGHWGPSVGEQFSAFGWSLMNADPSRIPGYQNMLAYLELRAGGPLATVCDTPGNQAVMAQWMEMATDPDAPNEVLKTDVDPNTGEGGDDHYDCSRYALMSRPLSVASVVSPLRDHQNRGFDKWLKPVPVRAGPRVGRIEGSRLGVSGGDSWG